MGYFNFKNIIIFLLIVIIILLLIPNFSRAESSENDNFLVVNINENDVVFNIGDRFSSFFNNEKVNILSVRVDNTKNVVNNSNIILKLFLSNGDFYLSSTFNSTSSDPRFAVFSCNDNREQISYYYLTTTISFRYSDDYNILTTNILNAIDSLTSSNFSLYNGLNMSVYSNMASNYNNILTFPIGSYYNFYNMTTFPSLNSNVYNQNAIDTAVSVEKSGGDFFAPAVVLPFIFNDTDFSTGNVSSIGIYLGNNFDFSNLYLHIFEVSPIYSTPLYSYNNLQNFKVSNFTIDYEYSDNTYTGPYAVIPNSFFNFSFENGKTYSIFIDNNSIIYDDIFDGMISQNDIIQGNLVYSLINFSVTGKNSQNTLTDFSNNFFNNNISNDTNNKINNSLNQNNNSNVDNISTGFFSNLLSKFNSFTNYNLNEDTIINIPIVDSNIVLHSNSISSMLNPAFLVIINMFWSYVFGMYLLKFILKIYKQIKTGNIIEKFDTNGETITTTML